MLASVLCPTDFSEASAAALEHGAALASAFGGTLTVLHVMPQTLMHPELFPYVEEPIFVPPDIEARARERLEAFASEAASVVPVEPVLESGDPAHRILSHLERMSSPLVVLGTHGRGGVKRFFLGSVAERVVRSADTPVLTVSAPPREASAGERLPYRSIVAAVDFSESSRTAVRVASFFWEKARGELVLLHVREPDEDGAVNAHTIGDELRALLPHEIPSGCHFEILVLDEGEPFEEILRVASEREADLIAAGAVGWGALDPAHFGSKAHALVRAARHPILTVRGSSAKLQEEKS